ncbi:hypothetical protein HDU97_003418 [Phlyctochytrium planicorne]|nr:hypothetical protein HDU97_003418 [Phlyctochytrium planicorne]
MSGLSQDDFRKLLATPRPVAAAQAKAPKQKEKPKPKTDDAAFAKPELPKKKKKEYGHIHGTHHNSILRWKKPDAEAAPAFRDRAKERREGYNPDYADTDLILQTLKASTSSEDADNGLSYEQSKFLGGDMDHTHLVKGLDHALLQKVKTDLDSNRAERDSEQEALHYLDSLHGEDGRPKFQSKLAESIYDIAVTKSAFNYRKSIDTFIPGRTAFVFNVTSEVDELPTMLFRSKADFREEKRGTADDALVIEKIIKLMQIRRGENKDLRLPSAAAKVAKNDVIQSNYGPQAVNPTPKPSEDDDEDEEYLQCFDLCWILILFGSIFADAGRDYTLDLKGREDIKPSDLSDVDMISNDEGEISEGEDDDMFDEEYKPSSVGDILAASSAMLGSLGGTNLKNAAKTDTEKSTLSKLQKLRGGYGEDFDMMDDVEYAEEELEEGDEQARRYLKETIAGHKSHLAEFTKNEPTRKPRERKPDATGAPAPTKQRKAPDVKAKLNRELQQVDKVMSEKYGKSILKKRQKEGDDSQAKRHAPG